MTVLSYTIIHKDGKRQEVVDDTTKPFWVGFNSNFHPCAVDRFGYLKPIEPPEPIDNVVDYSDILKQLADLRRQLRNRPVQTTRHESVTFRKPSVIT